MIPVAVHAHLWPLVPPVSNRRDRPASHVPRVQCLQGMAAVHLRTLSTRMVQGYGACLSLLRAVLTRQTRRLVCCSRRSARDWQVLSDGAIAAADTAARCTLFRHRFCRPRSHPRLDDIRDFRYSIPSPRRKCRPACLASQRIVPKNKPGRLPPDPWEPEQLSKLVPVDLDAAHAPIVRAP